MEYLLFDIGSSKSRFAASDGEDVSEIVMADTPQNFDEAMQEMANLALSITDSKFSLAVGGVAGGLNAEKNALFEPVNLPHWHNRNICEALSSLLGCSVYLENDVSLAGLGEASFGAGVGHEIVMYITASTGVNAAKITSQKIDENRLGFETGKQILDIWQFLDNGTTSHGTLEEFVGGRNLERKMGKPPEEIKDETFWREVARYLAVGIYNSVLHWSPDVVVVGGGVSKSIPLDTLRSMVFDLVTRTYPDYPDVVQASLGESSAILGAKKWLKTFNLSSIGH